MPSESVIRKKAIQILEKGRWITWYPPKVKFRQTDVFGIIDLLALKGRKIKYIQLTTLSNISFRRKKIIYFLKKFKIELLVDVWAWDRKKKKFKKEVVNVKSKKKYPGRPKKKY